MKAQNFEWATNIGIGNNSGDYASSFTTDIFGNVYSTGSFLGTVDFDPSEQVFNLEGGDIFISKLDEEGNFIWAKKVGGNNGFLDYANSIITDEYGNIYITGFFAFFADFDPNEGLSYLYGSGQSDAFVLKLDSEGNFVWAKKIGGSSHDQGVSISTDSSGNVYTTGYFTGTVDFNPGSDVFSLTSAGDRDAFILKLDSDGNFVWAHRMGGIGNDDPVSIDLDNYGNIYVTGRADDVPSSYFGFDENNFNLLSDSTNQNLTYILKLDNNGDFVWFKATDLIASWLLNVTIDGVGNLYLSDLFFSILKIDSFGNYLWTKNIETFSAELDDNRPTSMACDTDNNLYVTGYFQGSVDFNPSEEVFELTSAGGKDVFIMKLDSNGNFVWAKKNGESSDDIGASIITDLSGNLYTISYLNGTADTNFQFSDTYNLVSGGNFDAIISKFNQNELETFPSIGMFGTLTNFADIVMNTEDGITYTAENISFPSLGVVKFRQDGNWAKNWGSSDFPSGTGTQGGADIPVPFGSYDVTFNYETGAYNFELVLPTTQLTTLCNGTLTGMSQKIFFEQIPEAQEYTFSITDNATNFEHEIVTTNRYFRINEVPNFGFNMSYSVKGKVKVDDLYGAYGAVCTLNTPERLGKLRDNLCDQTFTKFNENLKSIILSNATAYKFKLINGENTQILESATSTLPLISFSNILPNTTYQISVAIEVNGAWLPYGDVCNITTAAIPTTTLRTAFCNGTSPTLTRNFVAISKPFATAYRFKTTINGSEVVIEKVIPKCRMSEFAGATINQTYSIQVAMQVNGVWSEYGDACNWTVGTVGVRLINENAVSIANENFNIKAYPNPFENQITLSLSNENIKSDIMVYDMTGKLIQQVSTQENILEIGNQFTTGVYLVQITQGQETKNIRVVKQ